MRLCGDDRLSGPSVPRSSVHDDVEDTVLTRETGDSPPHADSEASRIYAVSALCRRILKTVLYRYFMIGIIIVNSLWVGIDADYNADYSSSGTAHTVDGSVIYLVESILCGIFTVEILVRVLSKYPRTLEFFYCNEKVEWMNIFDLLITIITVVDDWILELVLPSRDSEQLEFFILVRAARLFRLVRLLGMVDSLFFLSSALTAALRSVTAAFVILFTTIYIWAVVFTEWSDDAKIETVNEYFADHYSTLFLSMLSMFELAIYDDAMYQVRAVLDESVLMGILLMIFIIIGGLLILNVLIGVIADVVSDQSDIEQARQLVAQMDDIFSFIDTDRNDRINKVEFLKHGRPLLLKVGISDYIIEGVASIIDISSVGASVSQYKPTSSVQSANPNSTNFITRDEFIHFMTKMLSAPSSEDLLLINRKIESLKLKFQKLFPN